MKEQTSKSTLTKFISLFLRTTLVAPSTALVVMAVLLPLASCEYSPNDSETKILFGRETTDHPAVIKLALRQADGRTMSCTGTFVSEATILTAGHCSLGGTVLFEGKPVEAVHTHPAFDKELPPVLANAMDLAVIQVSPQPGRAFLPVSSGAEVGDRATLTHGCVA